MTRPPGIDPILEGPRPFWSVMIPTYEGGSLLGHTLRSVLSQAPSPAEMQIEVVDDCSTSDRPEPVVEEIAPGRVSVHRHPENIGISANFTACVERSRGEWVHILHGDDLVADGFYDQVRSVTESNDGLGAVIVGCDVIDASGHVIASDEPLRATPGFLDDGFVRRLFHENPVRTPSIVVRRSVYENLGAFAPTLRHCADWDMWKRVIASTPTWFEPRRLARYRVHNAADTVLAFASGENVRDAVRSVALARHYLEPERSPTYTREGYTAMRRWAWSLARARGDRTGVSSRSVYLRLAARCLVGEAAEVVRGLRRPASEAG